WEELSETKKDSLDLEMAVYSAIIDRMDQNIGRILAKLKVNNKLENTLIMFLVDNGACPFYSNKIKNIQPGPANSYWSQRSSWSNLANTPFRQYKQCGHEGGSHTPFIAYWPGVIKPNTITAQPGHVVDIAPTFIDILNISYPDSIAGFPSLALAGKSLLPIFKGDERTEPDYFISGLDKFRMYRSGDYKIVRLNGGSWELYNIIEDPTEMNNLATVVPEILKKLASEYAKKEGGLNKVSFATNKN
ncbi:MAG: arylsulfatase A-like enzyme, partial [Arcticibacterium sp.]